MRLPVAQQLAHPVDPEHHGLSDAALVAEARRGSDAATSRLRSRHTSAVHVLSDVATPEVVGAAWDDVDARLSAGPALDGPVRIAWLERIAFRSTGHAADTTDITWHSFEQLSPAWQTVLWHHEVEGDSPRTVAHLLGIDAEDVPRTVHVARASLRRGVARRHEPHGDRDCDQIVEHLRVESSPVLDGKLIRSMREHCRHCDACLPLVRDIFRVEHSLRDVLADQVLGSHAADYLRGRRPVRALPASKPAMAGAAALVKRTRQPVVALALTGLTALAVVGALTVHTVVSDDPRVTGPEQASIVEVVPGTTTTVAAAPLKLVPTTQVPVSIKEGSVRVTPAVRRPDKGGAATPAAAAPPAEVSTEPTTTTPAEPTPPVDEHPTPPDPVTPPKDDDQPPAGGGGDNGATDPKHQPIKVDVDSDNGSVSVSVDVPVVPPVTVTTPPLADVPVVGAPVAGAVGGVIKVVGGGKP